MRNRLEMLACLWMQGVVRNGLGGSLYTVHSDNGFYREPIFNQKLKEVAIDGSTQHR